MIWTNPRSGDGFYFLSLKTVRFGQRGSRWQQTSMKRKQEVKTRCWMVSPCLFCMQTCTDLWSKGSSFSSFALPWGAVLAPLTLSKQKNNLLSNKQPYLRHDRGSSQHEQHWRPLEEEFADSADYTVNPAYVCWVSTVCLLVQGWNVILKKTPNIHLHTVTLAAFQSTYVFF